jgi:hypothetical protein
MSAMAETSKTTSDKTGDVLLSVPVVMFAKQDVGSVEERRFSIDLGAHDGANALSLTGKISGDVADTLEVVGNYLLEVRRA